MKIIKSAKDLGTIQFTCSECGTVFDAKRGEYRQSLTICYEPEKRFSIFGYPYTAIPSWRIVATCPYCKSDFVTIFIPTGEPTYSVTHND